MLIQAAIQVVDELLVQHDHGPVPDFFGGAVVNPQLARTAPDRNAAMAEHDRRPIDTLMGIPHKE